MASLKVDLKELKAVKVWWTCKVYTSEDNPQEMIKMKEEAVWMKLFDAKVEYVESCDIKSKVRESKQIKRSQYIIGVFR